MALVACFGELGGTGATDAVRDPTKGWADVTAGIGAGRVVDGASGVAASVDAGTEG